MSEEKLDLVSREQALRVARMLGCQGAHETEKGWMPCGSNEEYDAIKKSKEEYLKVLAAKKKKPLPKMVQRTKRLETKSDAYYENRADAVAISKARGCGGVRTVLLAGRKYYAVCDHKAPKRGWENLDEKPITGIATLPGGGLVTGSFSGKSLGPTVGEISSGKTPIDGDGDGFISRGGKDNVPAPVQKIVDAISSIRNAFKKGEKPADRFPIPDDWFKSPADAKRARETYPDMHMRYEEVFGMRRYVPATGLLKDDADGYDKFNDPNRAGVFMWRKYWMPSLTSSKSTVGDALRRWRGSFGDSRAFASALAGLDVAEQFKKDQDFLKKVEVLRAALADAPPMGMKTYRTMRLTPDVGKSAKVGSEFKFSAAAVGNEKVALMYENDEIGQAIKGADKMLVEFPADASGIFHDEQGNSRMGYPMVQGGDIAPQEGIISGRFRVAKIKKQTFTNPYSGKKITRNVHVLETIKSKTTIEEKGFVNFVSRSTDPDTFSDPESARIRSRNLGCIGIRRYTARDGKLVWMPCTNVSDYNRVTGIRGDNSPRNNPRRQGSAFKKKVLGTPIGAKPGDKLVDGDGDGFTTGGIVGGKDKIPVAPKLIRRTLQEKFNNGPQKLIGGMENGRNIPRVLSNKESRERYGNTKLGMQDYFQKKHGIKLEFSQETKDQKTVRLETIREDLRLGNTLMSETDIKKTAKKINDILNERVAQAKEMWKYLENPNAKETPKDYSLRTQTYPRFYEQASNMLAEVHGSMQALEDLLLNANLSEEDKSKLSVRLNIQDFDNPALDPEGYADVKRDKDGKAIISMNVMFKSWAYTLDGDQDTQRLASENAMVLQLGEVPAQVGTRFEAPLVGGENQIKVRQDLRRALEEMRDGEFFRRKGYATTVHEFAHVLDALAYENLEKWITQNPDDAEARQRLAKMKFLESMNDNNRANFLSLALMTSISENNPQISKYAAISFPERFAEQFTAWFLFSKAKGLFGDEEMRKRNADDEVEDVLGLHLDIQMKRTPIVPEIEKISSNFQKIMTRRHPVGQFIFGGLSNPKKKPKSTPTKGISEGVVLFKGVPKARKKPPTVTSTDINNLAIRVRQHNAKAKPAQRANLRDLKNVYLRGLQDGDKTSANKRISKFLSLLMSDKPKDVKYFDDNDLLPLDHPWRNRKTTKKWAGFDDGEYGVKYAEKCCPQVVKRYHAK